MSSLGRGRRDPNERPPLISSRSSIAEKISAFNSLREEARLFAARRGALQARRGHTASPPPEPRPPGLRKTSVGRRTASESGSATSSGPSASGAASSSGLRGSSAVRMPNLPRMEPRPRAEVPLDVVLGEEKNPFAEEAKLRRTRDEMDNISKRSIRRMVSQASIRVDAPLSMPDWDCGAALVTLDELKKSARSKTIKPAGTYASANSEDNNSVNNEDNIGNKESSGKEESKRVGRDFLRRVVRSKVRSLNAFRALMDTETGKEEPDPKENKADNEDNISDTAIQFTAKNVSSSAPVGILKRESSKRSLATVTFESIDVVSVDQETQTDPIERIGIDLDLEQLLHERDKQLLTVSEAIKKLGEINALIDRRLIDRSANNQSISNEPSNESCIEPIEERAKVPLIKSYSFPFLCEPVRHRTYSLSDLHNLVIDINFDNSVSKDGYEEKEESKDTDTALWARLMAAPETTLLESHML